MRGNALHFEEIPFPSRASLDAFLDSFGLGKERLGGLGTSLGRDTNFAGLVAVALPSSFYRNVENTSRISSPVCHFVQCTASPNFFASD